MIARGNGLKYTIAIINELNEDNYDLNNFEKDSNVLEKLLKALKMFHLEENLTNVLSICKKELKTLGTPEIKITNEDKKYILRYL